VDAEWRGQVGFLRGTRAAIILTPVAMILCFLSTTMPWYKISYYNEISIGDSTHIVSRSYTFYWDYYHIDRLGSIAYESTPVGSLMHIMTILILVWMVFSVVYIASCVLGARALIRGIIVQACSIIPVICYAAGIASAIADLRYDLYNFFVPPDFFGSISFHPYDGSSRHWGPMLGWFVLAIACVIQVAVITRRNAPLIAAILNQRRMRKYNVQTGAENEGE